MTLTHPMMASSHIALRNVAALGVLIALPGTASAAKDFHSAEVTKVVNEVRILFGERSATPASIGAVIRGDSAVQTGRRSRSELMFPDESVVRLGSNSVFSFEEGERDLHLIEGTMLLQAPKFHGRTRITTAAVTAAITGTTIMLEFVPPVIDESGKTKKPGTVKIIVIEGKLEFSLVRNPREKMRLRAGEMVVIRTTDTELPDAPLIVDLERLVGTSLLVRALGPLPDMRRINREIAQQSDAKDDAELLTFRVADADPVPPTGAAPLDAIFKARIAVNNAPPQPVVMMPAPPRRQPRPDPVRRAPPPVVPQQPNCTDISGPIPIECRDIINDPVGDVP